MTPATETLFIGNITVPDRRREIDAAAVKVLASSMQQLGLRTPITIRSNSDDMAILVAGAHRLEAAKSLGWEKIDCFVLDCSEDEAAMWEISENLHRAELTVLQRSEQVAKWVELAAKAGQLDQPGGQQPKDKGVSRASRELNVERTEVRRAVKVAALTDEAKQAAHARGLDDNQSALIAAAAVSPERQAEAIHNYADAKERSAAERANVPKPKEWLDAEADQKRSLMAAWNKCSPAVREWFLLEIDKPVMDGPGDIPQFLRRA